MGHSNATDVSGILKATRFAAERHKTQQRKGATRLPYVNHVIEVAALVAEEGGVDDVEIIQAALLHDTVEDTETTFEELKTTFGLPVTDLVREMTDDKTLPKAERKHLQIEKAPDLTDRAKVIKLADKISNITDILIDRPSGWSIDRCRDYVAWGEAVIAGCRGVNAALETLFDQTVERAWKELGRVRSDTIAGQNSTFEFETPPS